MVDERLMDKIKKLFALATSSNEHEAAAAMAKAQQLMREHDLTLGHLHLADIKHVKVRSRFSVSKLKPYENILMGTITNAFGCELVWFKSNSALGSANYWAHFAVVGHKSHVEVASYVAEVLLRKLTAARTKFVTGLGKLPRATLTMEADGFSVGWTRGIANAIKAMAPSGTQHKDAVKAYLKQEWGITDDAGHAATQKRKLGLAGYTAGQEAGSKERLNHGVGSSAEQRLAISQQRLAIGRG